MSYFISIFLYFLHFPFFPFILNVIWWLHFLSQFSKWVEEDWCIFFERGWVVALEMAMMLLLLLLFRKKKEISLFFNMIFSLFLLQHIKNLDWKFSSFWQRWRRKRRRKSLLTLFFHIFSVAISKVKMEMIMA